MDSSRPHPPMATPQLVCELFGDDYDLWTGHGELRRIRQSVSGNAGAVGNASHRHLLELIARTRGTGESGFRAYAGSFLCSLPVMADGQFLVATASVAAEQAARVMALTTRRLLATIGGTVAERTVDSAVSDPRLRTDRNELSWLSHLPDSVVPQRGEQASDAAARILPQLQQLIHAGSLMFVVQGNSRTQTCHLLWSGGRRMSPQTVTSLIEYQADTALSQEGLCLNFNGGNEHWNELPGVASAMLVPVAWPGSNQAWLAAFNKDLSRLASGTALSRYGIEIQAEDIEFGEAEINLMRAASSALSTSSGILGLLQERHDMLTGIVRTLVNALDAKDSYTCGHSDRVAEFARITARAMGLPADECERIHMAGLLHDIGKVGIPEHVLNKQDRLTDEEMGLIRRHPVTGYEILRHLSSFEYVLPGVLHHHESFDGSGYPYRLSGQDIPLSARILAVADAWDAMTSDRSYRQGMSAAQARDILRDGAGRQWDPACVSAFLKNMDAVRLRMDQSHQTPAAPHMVRPAAVSSLVGWPQRQSASGESTERP